MGRLWIGTSGWSYPEWRGSFYPTSLRRKDELAYAARHFDSIEINGSFYSLLRPANYRQYHEQTRPGFLFAVKGGQFITHFKALKDVETPLANFFASGVLRLTDKLGPMLWQVPARMRFDAGRVGAFLDMLPRDTTEAALLAEQHDERMVGRSWTERGPHRRLRHAFEVRSPSLLTPELVRICRRTRIALVVSDAATWPITEELTAGFVYIRLHGSQETYASRYSDAELDRWAARIEAWRAGGEPADARRITSRIPPRHGSRDVFVYFDNDAQGHAPHDALRLAERLRDSDKPPCSEPHR
jgi:uncharacterized protein YecE (DUF72 family)